MTQPLISIIIPSLNEERRLPTLLKDIEEQRLEATGLEVILIDNGSTDQTMEIMQEYGNSHQSVRVLRYLGVQSFCYQLGLEKASGSWVAFIGADMGLPHNWLRIVQELIANHSEDDAFVARILPLFRRNGPYNNYIRGYFYGATGKAGEWEEATFHSGGLVVKREAALKVGFNRNLRVAEDGEFSFRFLRSGFHAYYHPENIVLDEQYYDFSGLVSYYKKLGMASVVLLKNTGTAEVVRGFLRSILEPITPHYIHIRYRRACEFTTIERRKWILAGMARMYCMVSAVVLYGLIRWPVPNKVLRRKG